MARASSRCFLADTAVMRDGRMMLFGGLFTNIEENTIYIMKDFLDVDLQGQLGSGADALGEDGCFAEATAAISTIEFGTANQQHRNAEEAMLESRKA